MEGNKFETIFLLIDFVNEYFFNFCFGDWNGPETLHIFLENDNEKTTSLE